MFKKIDTPLKLWDTATRQKEDIIPLRGKNLKVYTCGPTVYNYAHIGNFRTYIFEDLLRRTAKFLGYQIQQVMNFTDVDDKTIKGALEEGLPLGEYTQRYKQAFLKDLEILNIEPVEHRPSATEFIPDMIVIIKSLMRNGFAYQGSDGSVYFSISKFQNYGKLSHLPMDELLAGGSDRVDSDEYDKENISDFVLWKSYDAARDGEFYWSSPFGNGRPGWHLECTAMALKLLGKTIDIHCGGVDNIFPHHENELAQSEAYTGQPFVKHWVHSEYLLVDNKKMSKSLGNFYTLRDLLIKGYTGRQVRYMLLQTHYRTPLNFTFEGLEAAKASLERLDNFVLRLKEVSLPESSGAGSQILEKAHNAFKEALVDDLNISRALAALFDVVRDINGLIDKNTLSQKESQQAWEMLKEWDDILGFLDFEEDVAPAELLDALEERQQARRERNWEHADALRDYIQSRGYIIEDTPNGARLKRV
ncbi:MAG: cysteine--tRNA ligase [Chlamydiota bacterium]